MTHQRIDTGRQAEDIACVMLVEMGYQIIERNYRTPFGELDIIAQDKGTWCFIEVRCKTTDNFGDAFESVDHFKQRKIYHLAECYLEENNLVDVDARFDVVAVDSVDGSKAVEIIKNAFELSN